MSHQRRKKTTAFVHHKLLFKKKTFNLVCISKNPLTLQAFMGQEGLILCIYCDSLGIAAGGVSDKLNLLKFVLSTSLFNGSSK